MFAIFRALSERLKALFVADVAQDFEAQLLGREAERRAELLRRAARYDGEGLHGIAHHLRRQGEQLDVQAPLASVLPAIAHLQADGEDAAVGKHTRNNTTHGSSAKLTLHSPDQRKQGGKA